MAMLRFESTIKEFVLVMLFLVYSSASLYAGEKEMPPMPYYDRGACPFEGCSYGELQVCATTSLQKENVKSAPIVFKVKKGEMVEAITGVVITTQPGVVKVLKSITLDEENPVALKPGDVFYTLHYQGEGYDLFWHKGMLHSDQMEYHNDLPGAIKDTFQVVREYKYDWWIQIKNSVGKIGWTKETGYFRMGGCE